MTHPDREIYATFAGADLVLRLPVAPSVNRLYTSRGGRAHTHIKSAQYRDWLQDADNWYLTQRAKIRNYTPTLGPYTVDIVVPKTRGDPDNRIKATLDYLVKRGLTPDDRHCRRATVTVDPGLESNSEMWIAVRAA